MRILAREFQERGDDGVQAYLKPSPHDKLVRFSHNPDSPVQISGFDFSKHNVVFYQAQLFGGLLLKDCNFSEVYFQSCHFHGRVEFLKCAFQVQPSFHQPVFHGPTLVLSDSRGPGGQRLELSFPGPAQNQPSDLQINDCKIHLQVGDLRLKTLSLINCELEGTRLDFGGLKELTIKNASIFGPTDFKGDLAVDISDAVFKKNVSIEVGKDKKFTATGILRSEDLTIRAGEGSSVSLQCSHFEVPLLTINGIPREVKLSQSFRSGKIEKVIVPPNASVLVNLEGLNIGTVRMGPSSVRSQDGLPVFDSAFQAKGASIEHLYFKNTYFNSTLDVSDCQLHKVTLESCSFSDRTTFNRTCFKKAPAFYKSKFHPSTSFSACEFEDYTLAAIPSFKDLKHKMIESKDHIAEQLFHSLELESRWKNSSPCKNFSDWFFGTAYFVSNRFGRLIWLPLVWLALVTLLPWVCFYRLPGAVVVSSPPPTLLAQATWLDEARNLGPDLLGLYYTAINSMGPLKLHPSAAKFEAGSLFVQILGTFHAIAATYLWFLIFSWIRRRFRTD